MNKLPKLLYIKFNVMSTNQNPTLDGVVSASSNFILSSLVLRAGLQLSNISVLAFITDLEFSKIERKKMTLLKSVWQQSHSTIME